MEITLITDSPQVPAKNGKTKLEELVQLRKDNSARRDAAIQAEYERRNPLTTFVKKTIGLIHRDALDTTEANIAVEEKRLQERKVQIAKIKEEREKLACRKAEVVAKQQNLRVAHAALVKELEDASAKTDNYVSTGPVGMEGLDAFGWCKRLIEMRAYEHDLRAVVASDLPVAEKACKDALSKIETEIIAFEKRAIA